MLEFSVATRFPRNLLFSLLSGLFILEQASGRRKASQSRSMRRSLVICRDPRRLSCFTSTVLSCFLGRLTDHAKLRGRTHAD